MSKLKNQMQALKTLLAMAGLVVGGAGLTGCEPRAEAQVEHCTCMGATTSYKSIDCVGPNGSTFKATQTCWTKHSLESGKVCGTVCEAAINVCRGVHGQCN